MFRLASATHEYSRARWSSSRPYCAGANIDARLSRRVPELVYSLTFCNQTMSVVPHMRNCQGSDDLPEIVGTHCDICSNYAARFCCSCSKRPSRPRSAPLKSRCSWPNSSLDQRLRYGREIDGAEGRLRRGGLSWIGCADISFPSPLSPVNASGALVGAASPIRCVAQLIASD